MANVYVSIGSNINREHHVTESLKALNERFAPCTFLISTIASLLGLKEITSST